MFYAAVGVAVNVLGSLALFWPFGHVGIAAATSISGAVNAALLGWTLRRRGHFVTDRRLIERLTRIALASACMGLALFALQHALGPYFQPRAGMAAQFAALGLLVGGGLVAFGLAAILTGAIRRDEIASLLHRRRPA
jgi:putative peptidoglycan lipid II flippase